LGICVTSWPNHRRQILSPFIFWGIDDHHAKPYQSMAEKDCGDQNDENQ
jgi:hypothetical protein